MIDKNLFLGQNDCNELIFFEIKDNKIRGFNHYYLVDKTQSADEQYYLDNCAWTHDVTIDGVQFKTGDDTPINHTHNLDDDMYDLIFNSNDVYEASLAYCSDCGLAHDTDDVYRKQYIITEDCEVYCKTCIDVDDCLKNIGDDADNIFKARDISDCDISHLDEIECLFCDSSGFGRDHEAALTRDQAINRVNDLIDVHGGDLKCGITGIGQFQVYVSIFK